MAGPNDRTAVLLLNMGGPDSLRGIRPFLFRLFSDPAILALPAPLRIPLAAFISTLRAPRVAPKYAAIGGGSPIRRLTDEQGAALEEELAARGVTVTCHTAFRYSPPFIAEAVDEALAEEAEKLVALSLYPQSCRATTGTSLDELKRVLKRKGIPVDEPGEMREKKPGVRLKLVDSWPDHPGYLDALADTVTEAFTLLSPDEQARVVIVFSAHGVPQSLIDAGDPYRVEIERTVAGVMERLGDLSHRLAFQSKVGPVEWLRPSLAETLADLAIKEAPPIVVVPISFVSDHIETLHELDIEYAELAHKLGIPRYLRAPALNSRPDFISALADLVQEALQTPPAQ